MFEESERQRSVCSQAFLTTCLFWRSFSEKILLSCLNGICLAFLSPIFAFYCYKLLICTIVLDLISQFLFETMVNLSAIFSWQFWACYHKAMKGKYMVYIHCSRTKFVHDSPLFVGWAIHNHVVFLLNLDSVFLLFFVIVL